MSTPPHGDDADDERPPPGMPLPPPSGPANCPPRRRISGGAVFGGIMLYFTVNFVLGWVLVGVTDPYFASSNGVFAIGAVLIVLIAFGGGTVLLRSANPGNRGLGLGFMIGWALTSLFTVGFCTGINPTMYTW